MNTTTTDKATNNNVTANNPDGICYARHIYNQAQDKATARPLHFESYGEHRFVICEGGQPICELSHFDVETRNKAIDRCNRIVQAVNERDALIACAECLQRRNEVMPTRESTAALANLAAVRGGGKA